MVAFFICALLLTVFGVYLGFIIGRNLGERAVTTADYWKMNAAAIVVTVLLSAVLSGLPLLTGGIIGLLAGCIVGIKMGFGESVGPWRTVDRAFNVNKSHREAAESGTGEERRARRRKGEKEPDLISVADNRPKSDKNAKDAR